MHLVNIASVNSDAEPLFDPVADTHFRLFTRLNPNSGQLIVVNNNAQLAASNFNPALPTRFMIHGWNGGGANSGASMARAWLDQINCNAFGVDWGAGARTPNYVLARNRVGITGHAVGAYIEFLHRNGLSFSNVVVAGHSLGAHVAAFAGKRVRQATGSLIHAVVGLDPAGPLFSLDDPANRIDHTDATYVESIVTDGGRLGFEHPVGHANFYPNWGTTQPMCPPNDFTGQCSHSIVSTFFGASFNSSHIFGATRCRDLNDIRNRNCVQSGPSRRMGGEPVMDGVSPVGSVFFLATYVDPPFAQGPR
ncbi:lipase member I-like [Bradysia coprophila]|uniref:lipase member I-like n=1 Tax=Bradysia coprophila TaxID=38358 RepID=UPI00187D81B9|nr:lipase member I-like [Bradysia coprophila]